MQHVVLFIRVGLPGILF